MSRDDRSVTCVTAVAEAMCSVRQELEGDDQVVTLDVKVYDKHNRHLSSLSLEHIRGRTRMIHRAGHGPVDNLA